MTFRECGQQIGDKRQDIGKDARAIIDLKTNNQMERASLVLCRKLELPIISSQAGVWETANQPKWIASGYIFLMQSQETR